MKRFLSFFLFTTAMLLLPTLAKYLTDGFRLAKMRVDFPPHPEWEVALDPDIIPLLNQPFHYLDKGSQCYVFESADRKIVIKFFRFNEPKSYLKTFTLFNATRIAYETLKKETGLLYIHLNVTNLNLPTLHCKDAIGRSYHFKLDECRFAIQKKATPFHLTLKNALSDPTQMQKRLDQFIDLLFARTDKGIFNTDPSLSRNFGFLDDQAVEIDFGNYRPTTPHGQRVEIERYTKKLRRWLNKKAPEWAEYLDAQIKLKSEKNQYF